MQQLLNLSSRSLGTTISRLDLCYTASADRPVSYIENGWTHNLNLIAWASPTREDLGELCHACNAEKGYVPAFEPSPWKHGDLPLVTSPDTGEPTIPTFLMYNPGDRSSYGLYLLDYHQGRYLLPVHSSRLKEMLTRHTDPELVLIGISSICQIFSCSSGGKLSGFDGHPPAFLISGNLSSMGESRVRNTMGGTLHMDFHEFTIRGFSYGIKRCYSILPGTREHLFLNKILGNKGKI